MLFSTRLREWIPRGSALLLLILFVVGCSEAPSTPNQTHALEGSQEIEGTIDPEAETFVLQSIDTDQPEPGYGRAPLQLVGRGLTVDRENQRVTLEIALRNLSRTNYHPRIEVVALHFVPETVTPINADWSNCDGDSAVPVPVDECRWTFDYSDLLGEDDVLTPGETSEFRPWTFHVPGLTGFSFSAFARVAFEPLGGEISGVMFWDGNENGRIDSGESPLSGGQVEISGPEGFTRTVPFEDEGRFSVRIRSAGLYSLQAFPPPTFGFVPLKFTTPNPLEVVIPPDPDGGPGSFHQANFGVVTDLPDPNFPPIGFLPDLGDSIRGDRYELVDLRLEGKALITDVSFSGCDENHPFQLFMIGEFRESEPPTAILHLIHDDLGQMCLAQFRRELPWDLGPLIERYHQTYGYTRGGTSRVRLVFEDWQGMPHERILEF